MLLIVPATFIFGSYVNQTTVARISAIGLFFLGIVFSIKELSYYKQFSRSREEISDYIQSHSAEKDFILIAGFGNQYIHVMSDRLSSTKFIMPLLEPDGYSGRYKALIKKELIQNPPVFIVLSKNGYRSLNPNDFYTKTILDELRSYYSVFGNDEFTIYRRLEQNVSAMRKLSSTNGIIIKRGHL
jgi:hypothetical protein